MTSEKCGWNPVLSCKASAPSRPTDCGNDAVISIGHIKPWHVCESCAALPYLVGLISVCGHRRISNE